jgi:DNA-binding SARP family transcriptional activator/TolB-like protein
MLRIRTLGGLSVQGAGQAPAGAATQPRRLAVLALVARAGERGVTREKLLAMLWPDADEESGRRALSQSLYALRRDLAADELFLGVQELRLNPEAATCDLLDFEASLSERNLERAANVYGGPFLDGFRLPGAPEFDRWVEDERRSLEQRHLELLERLARRLAERGDPAAAAIWWRRIADLDPLNARVAIELMRALLAAGDPSGALKHARIYEALLAQEMDIAPDRQVIELAQRIRNEAATAAARPVEQPARAAPAPATVAAPSAPPTPLVVPPSDVQSTNPEPAPAAAGVSPMPAPAPAPNEPSVAPVASTRRRRPYRRLVVASGSVAVLAAAAWWSGVGRRSTTATPTLAIGRIVDYRTTDSRDADAISDMLATNLARVRGLQVLSSARLYEVIGQSEDARPSSAAVSRAAARAGATELVEGGLHAVAGGRLLLDLRRVDLATGAVRGAYRSEGSDVYALVTEATTDLAGSLDHPVGPLDPADVSTKSLVAYRFYEEGLRSYGRGDFRSAEQMLGAALAEDSAFAMAAFYRMQALDNLGQEQPVDIWDRVLALAGRAPDRERLLIRGTWALVSGNPELQAIADTLATRYPAEVDAPFLQGYARLQNADFLGALPYLNRVLAVDSLGLRGQSARCRACDALTQLAYAYHSLDSLPAVERLARDYTRQRPRSALAWNLLGGVFVAQDRHAEALETYRKALSISPVGAYDRVYPAIVHIRSGDFEEADRLTRSLIQAGSAIDAREARWTLMVSLRYQGRWREAVALARDGFARLPSSERPFNQGRLQKAMEAVALLESGRSRDAAALWDSLARAGATAQSRTAGEIRYVTAQYTLLASALAAAGDTARLGIAADSAAAWGARSTNRRDHLLIDHARGLLSIARHDTAAGIAALERAIYSPTSGFTRTNRELGALFLAQRRPADAVRVLGAALRSGTLESGSLYVTRTELHELIARAFDDLGKADSAAMHYQYVVKALAKSDPEARPRYDAAAARLAALRR